MICALDGFTDMEGEIAEKIEGIFSRFAEVASAARWRGCGFQRTVAELGSTPGHPAVKAGAAHKKRFQTWLAKVLSEASVKQPEVLAIRILVLLDGASVVMLIHRDTSYVRAAGSLAAELVRNAKR